MEFQKKHAFKKSVNVTCANLTVTDWSFCATYPLLLALCSPTMASNVKRKFLFSALLDLCKLLLRVHILLLNLYTNIK